MINKEITSERKIAEILHKWKQQSGINKIKYGNNNILFKIDRRTNELYIFTYRVGLLIGRNGELIEKYKKLLLKENVTNVKLIETSDCWF